MGLTKRGKYWHYDFIYRGKRLQGSTEQTNVNKARLALAAIRSDVALEHLGVAPPKLSPLFRDFAERFLSHVRQHSKKPRTVEFYEARTARLLDYFADYRLSDIDENLISRYKADRAVMKRRARGRRREPMANAARIATAAADFVAMPSDGMATGAKLSTGTINRELATLRKALGLAYEWRLISRLPKMRLLPGERGREYVLTGEMETAYLGAIAYPLKQAAILMLDLGLRPEECCKLRKADISQECVSVREGKSINAPRMLPMTSRCKDTIDLLMALFPSSEWLFPGKRGRHLTRAHLDHLHQTARRENNWPKEFVIYSCRHTYGTRLAESGASPFEICRLMGHSSVKVSERYIHLSADSLTLAAKRAEAYSQMLRGETHEENSPKVVR